MDMEELKLRLKLKYLTRQIESWIVWNFGYCPAGDKDFDALLEERDRLINIAKDKYPDTYNKFE